MTAPDGLAGPDPAAGLDPEVGPDPDSAAGPGAEASPDALRELVREVLREVLPVIAGQLNPLKATSTGSGPAQRHIDRVAGGSPGPPGPASNGSQPAQRHIERVASSGPGPAAGSAAAGPGGTVRAIRLASDEELHAFVAEVLRLADDPRQRHDLLAGRLRFTLGDRIAGSVPAAALAGPATRKIDKGAVTERAVIAAAKAGERLVLGPRAVLTPLARDKARALGVPVEKER